MKLPDFSAVPMGFSFRGRRKDEALQEFISTQFGVSFEQHLIDNRISFKNFSVIYRITNTNYAHEDLWCSDQPEINCKREETSRFIREHLSDDHYVFGAMDEVCLSVFCYGRRPAVDPALNQTLCVEATRLHRSLATDLHLARLADYLAIDYFQSDDDGESARSHFYRDYPAWMRIACQIGDPSDRGQEHYEKITSALMGGDQQVMQGVLDRSIKPSIRLKQKQIVRCIDRIEEAESLLLDVFDLGPVNMENLNPEEGLFNFFSDFEFEPELMEHMRDALWDMCSDNMHHELVMICNNQEQLSATHRYLAAVDALYDLFPECPTTLIETFAGEK